MTSEALRAATEFMQHKGYSDVEPVSIERDGDLDVWYFLYELKEGTLELEVEWNGSRWFWEVIDFVHNRDKGETLTDVNR
jgi:hypothetical protein